MSWLRFFRRRYWDEQRKLELEAYLAAEIDDHIARGRSPEDARTLAYRKLGNPSLIREEIYQMNTIGLLETFWHDLRYGARLLRRNRTFAIVAILTLALGTGANAAIFQLVDAVRLRTLPVKDPQELVEINIDTNGKGRTGQFISRRPFMTEPLWRELHEHQQAFAAMLAWGTVGFNLAVSGESRPAQGLWVSGDFFQTLGVLPHAGRLLAPADDQKGCSAPGVVLSHAFWQKRFSGDPSVVGRPILLDGHPFDVIGVSQRGFFGVDVGRSFDIAAPICAMPITRGDRHGIDKRDIWFLDVFGRLKEGWTADKAQAQLQAVSPSVFRATLPQHYTPADTASYLAFKLTVKPADTGVSSLRGAYATPLWVLLGVTGLVLLIACANLANLMLARATARAREVAIRLAIGASRRRLVRQMLCESLLLAGLGAIGGFTLAQWFSRGLVAFLNTDSSSQVFVDLAPGWRVFWFMWALTGLACVLFGLAPALRATHANPGETMKAGARGTSDGREGLAIRRVLVVVQVALSLVLVVGAVLLGRTLRNLVGLDPGFKTTGVLIANIDLRRGGVPPERRGVLVDQVLDRVRSIPGVRSATPAFITPVSGSVWNNNVVVDGAVAGLSNFNAVGTGFFRTLGTPLVAGRDFDAHDDVSSAPVAIVNETFARQFLKGRNPLGQSFQIEAPPGEPRPNLQIVGVVKDTKYTDLREPFGPIGYRPLMQDKDIGVFLQLVVSSNAPLAGISSAVTGVVTDVNPNILLQYQTMEGQVRDSLLSERLMATLSGFFGGLAALIAAIGLYGVLSYMVARRRVEIGIRLALGAGQRSVLTLIMREAGVLLIVGILLGALLAGYAAKAVSTLLYGLAPWDPATYAIGALLLTLVSGLASWLPARRAARLPPTVALREE
ncbi:MAG TPA: ABC transporter permease [Vicinamibacterales bacterium]